MFSITVYFLSLWIIKEWTSLVDNFHLCLNATGIINTSYSINLILIHDLRVVRLKKTYKKIPYIILIGNRYMYDIKYVKITLNIFVLYE